MTDPVLFWHATYPVYGVFSQWYAHSFSMPPGFFYSSAGVDVPVSVLSELTDLGKITSDGDIIFSHAEQAMMFGKAIAMQDENIAIEVMKATTPKSQKALGRKVANFDSGLWQKISLDLVTEINFWKFQDGDIKKILLSTDDRLIAEASPWDRIWGIGLKPDDPHAKNPGKWQGRNLLGKALMSVRDRLRIFPD